MKDTENRRIGTKIYGYLFIETLFGIKKSKFSNIDFIIPKTDLDIIWNSTEISTWVIKIERGRERNWVSALFIENSGIEEWVRKINKCIYNY